MIPVEPAERSTLAGEYVTGLLEAADVAAIEAALPIHPALDADVAYWEERLYPMCNTVLPVTPDAFLWQKIERSLGLGQAAEATPLRATQCPLTRFWNSLGAWRMAAALTSLVALIAGVSTMTERKTSAPAFVAVLQTKELAPGWVVEINGDRDVHLIALGARDVAPGRGLQLWTLIDPTKGPVSLGMVPSKGPARFRAQPTPDIGEGQLFEISLEPETGSTIGRPSGPVLSVGRAVTIGKPERQR